MTLFEPTALVTGAASMGVAIVGAAVDVGVAMGVAGVTRGADERGRGPWI